MFRFILKRLLVFIPTLLVISLLAFVISVNAPGDPVERLLTASEETGGDASVNAIDKQKAANDLRKRLGLNLPVFYFSLQTIGDIDTIYRIQNFDHRIVIRRMARETGNPEGTLLWFNAMLETNKFASSFIPDSAFIKSKRYSEQVTRMRFLINSLTTTSEPALRQMRLDSLNEVLTTTPGVQPVRSAWKNCQVLLAQLKENSSSWKKWIPALHWYGGKNQYHLWMFGNGEDRKGVVAGDFGISYRDGQPISDRIWPRMKWSLTFSVLSLVLAYVISIPVGLRAGYKRGGWFDKISGSAAFALYSLPSFFAGTLLLVLFANPDVLDWFPSSGVKDPSSFDPSWPFWRRCIHYIPYLVLPLVTYTYASFAFISRQIRAGIGEQMQQDYIRTARAKGLGELRVVTVHAFRNTLLPVITILSQVLPFSFAGSVIIETIFSIPGMGKEIYQSILNYDYPMIVAVFTVFGFLTLSSYLLADVAYALADPRIRYSSGKR